MTPHQKALEWRRYGSGLAALALRVTNGPLQWIEHVLVRRVLRATPHLHAPVFVIGAPRSGSTLICKVLIDQYRFAYISNLSSYFFRTLCLGIWLAQRLRLAAPRQGYHSSYGVTEGWSSPNEAGCFWYRWFPAGMKIYVPDGELSAAARDEIRREIHAASALFGAPMIFKNLYNSMRIGPLLECFPEASFIVCERDPVQNALSLLRGRLEQQGDKTRWWTLPPREVEILQSRPYAEQVAGQVHYIYRQIYEDMGKFGTEHFFTVRYEEFCRDVHGSLQLIETFLLQRGHGLRRRDATVPRHFDVREVTGLDPADFDAVRSAINLYGGTEHRDGRTSQHDSRNIAGTLTGERDVSGCSIRKSL
jgi:Sulfotransferase family